MIEYEKTNFNKLEQLWLWLDNCIAYYPVGRAFEGGTSGSAENG